MKNVIFTIAALLLSTSAYAAGEGEYRTNRDPAAEPAAAAQHKNDRLLSADLERITEGSSVITIDMSRDSNSIPSNE